MITVNLRVIVRYLDEERDVIREAHPVLVDGKWFETYAGELPISPLAGLDRDQVIAIDQRLIWDMHPAR